MGILFWIFTIIMFFVAIYIAIEDDINFFGAFIMLELFMALGLFLVSFCFPRTEEEYIVDDGTIQGLELKDDNTYRVQGCFILGTGAASTYKNSPKYYFFFDTDKGKILQSTETDNVYIKETNDEAPNHKTIYKKTTFSGFPKILFGTWLDKDVKFGEILVVPENTIKIDYNVDI